MRQFASAESRVDGLERAALATDEKIARVADCLRLTQAFAEQRGDGGAPLSELSELRSFVEAAVRSCLSARVGAELAERIAAVEAAAAQAEERAMASVRDALDGHSQTFAERRAREESGGGDLDRPRAGGGAEARGGGGSRARCRGGTRRGGGASRGGGGASGRARGDGWAAPQAAALAEAREGHVRLLARFRGGLAEAALAGRAVAPRTPTAGERPRRSRLRGS